MLLHIICSEEVFFPLPSAAHMPQRCCDLWCGFYSTHHNVFQLHVEHVRAVDILFPFLCIGMVVAHVVQNQLEENYLLRHGAEGVVEAEHVVSFMRLHTAKTSKRLLIHS